MTIGRTIRRVVGYTALSLGALTFLDGSCAAGVGIARAYKSKVIKEEKISPEERLYYGSLMAGEETKMTDARKDALYGSGIMVGGLMSAGLGLILLPKE
jgi:hypothetical protein